MLWRPPRRSWCMHRILCTACNRNSTRSFERGHDGNILEEAYRGRYARQRLLNFWPESSCGYHAIKRFVCIIQVPTTFLTAKPIVSACLTEGTWPPGNISPRFNTRLQFNNQGRNIFLAV